MITTYYYVHIRNNWAINTICFLKLCQTERNLTYTEIHEQTNKQTTNKQLTPLSRVLLEKLTSSQLVKNFPTFMETKGSLPHLQEPTTCPYSKPDQSSPCPPIPLPVYPT